MTSSSWPDPKHRALGKPFFRFFSDFSDFRICSDCFGFVRMFSDFSSNFVEIVKFRRIRRITFFYRRNRVRSNFCSVEIDEISTTFFYRRNRPLLTCSASLRRNCPGDRQTQVLVPACGRDRLRFASWWPVITSPFGGPRGVLVQPSKSFKNTVQKCQLSWIHWIQLH